MSKMSYTAQLSITVWSPMMASASTGPPSVVASALACSSRATGLVRIKPRNLGSNPRCLDCHSPNDTMMHQAHRWGPCQVTSGGVACGCTSERQT